MKTLVGDNSSRTSDVDFVPRMGNYMVTPEMAQEWLDLFQYEHQRKIRPYHATALANEIKEGRFREYTQIAFCQGLFDGWYYLTNGYHTLSAIIQAQQPVLLSVIVKPVNTIQEVAADYTRHDSGLSRTIADALAVYELADKLGISKKELAWVATACFFYAYLKGQLGSVRSVGKLTTDQKRLIVEKNGALGQKALRLFSGGDPGRNSFFRRKSTLATAMLCVEHQPGIAKEFWTGVALDDGLKKGDPRKTLLDWLRNTSTLGKGNVTALGNKQFSDFYLVAGMSKAWNAFVEERSLAFIVMPKNNSNEVMFKGIGTFKIV